MKNEGEYMKNEAEMLIRYTVKLEEKLKVAVEALEHCAKYSVMDTTGVAKEALEKIKQ